MEKLQKLWQSVKNWKGWTFWKRSSDNQDTSNSTFKIKVSDHSFIKTVAYSVAGLIFIVYLVGVYWSNEPELFDVRDERAYHSIGQDKQFVVGYTTVLTTEKVARTLLDKPGGYLSNDVLPPANFLDNIPSWEFGVLVQVRDMASALRNHMSRSQSQSLENEFLKDAEPLFNNDHLSWIWPRAEERYDSGIKKLAAYRDSLGQKDNPNSQFYARADNLTAWLALIEKRLGGLSQRLAASVGQERINTDLSGDSAATQSTQVHNQMMVKTAWMEIDNTFYEARGACWALIHMLKAVQIDFEPVLEKKNAKASLAQIIRELEATQEAIWSPIILNGSGFGLVANHSLVMASYVSRANAGLIDLRELLSKG